MGGLFACDSASDLDSDDLGGALQLSDDESGVQVREMRKQFKAKRRTDKKESVNVYRQEFDTNVFEVKLNCLADKGQIATGDAEICERCQAVFN